ncbi:hypothetical protein AMATHDRAFT_45323 [Amanita thiersii Skay4041]|uniref:Uncharacterized protein n=1 Tax=Amanita thiersii Skay4041 TaxID=703135 RepID=A0A2A9NZJ2_9AGAR|nr:hypothetical protein AMATHDRAFT_45323 [Amanita thiersii Skay4041]
MTFLPPSLILFILSCFIPSSFAAPTDQQQDGSSSSTNPKIWIPVAIGILFLCAILIYGCTKASIRQISLRFSGGFRAAPTNSEISAQVRELTAEQLAGSINRNTSGDVASNNNNNTGRTRRGRRARRTPSQISTISLPAYMKEPGDQELVIYRGPMDMEDAPQPVAIVMDVVDEDGEESPPQHQSHNVQYPIPLDSPTDMPLLQDDGSHDLSSGSLHLSPTSPTRPSVDTFGDSIDSPTSLGRLNTTSSVPQEPPPSYELAATQSRQNPRTEISLNEPSSPHAAQSTFNPSDSPPRRSGFRTFLNSMNPNRQSQSVLHSPSRRVHQRINSEISVSSSHDSHSREGAQSRGSHRPSASASSSFFRTLSRQRSTRTLQNQLTSPSLISLNSISAPLTHTTVRTEFAYPKSGPTPEQLKLISSRESFARFGLPYGADAVAFAASNSRQDLQPPPDFDAAASTASFFHQAPSSISSVDASSSPSSATPSSLNSINPQRLSIPSGPQTDTTNSGSETRTPEDTDVAVVPPTPVEQPQADNATSSSAEATAITMPTPSAAVVPIPTENPTTTTAVSKRSLAPSAYKVVPTEFGARAESRASSYSMQSLATYATAAESMSVAPKSSEYEEPSESRRGSASSPIRSHHVLDEPSENTIIAAPSRTPSPSSYTDSAASSQHESHP